MQPDHDYNPPSDYGADYSAREVERIMLDHTCMTEREARIREINSHVPPVILPCKHCGKPLEVDMIHHNAACPDCHVWVWFFWYPYANEEEARKHGGA